VSGHVIPAVNYDAYAYVYAEYPDGWFVVVVASATDGSPVLHRAAREWNHSTDGVWSYCAELYITFHESPTQIQASRIIQKVCMYGNHGTPGFLHT